MTTTRGNSSTVVPTDSGAGTGWRAATGAPGKGFMLGWTQPVQRSEKCEWDTTRTHKQVYQGTSRGQHVRESEDTTPVFGASSLFENLPW